MKLRLYGTVNDSIVDGPGLRYAVFTQGCPHHCLGCHNPDSHDLEGGYLKEIDEICEEIAHNPLLDGVTLTGGEPFLQAEALIDLVKKIKQTGLHMMIYSGYTYEEILSLGEQAITLLSLCDTLVDGRFRLDLRSLDLFYKGSSNQRILNIQKTMKLNQIVEQKINEYGEFVD